MNQYPTPWILPDPVIIIKFPCIVLTNAREGYLPHRPMCLTVNMLIYSTIIQRIELRCIKIYFKKCFKPSQGFLKNVYAQNVCCCVTKIQTLKISNFYWAWITSETWINGLRKFNCPLPPPVVRIKKMSLYNVYSITSISAATPQYKINCEPDYSIEVYIIQGEPIYMRIIEFN